MILADTSVWIDYFRRGNAAFGARLDERAILMHPLILGELMLGGLPDQERLIPDLRALPAAPVASPDETVLFIGVERLAGRGIGYVDAALLASARLESGTLLWTRDRRLAAVAADMLIGYDGG